MNYLTVEQVLFLHARLIAETGGSHGVRDVGLLESAVARPQATFEGKDLYPDIFSKAAALMQSIIRNHPFIDGNKRTGIAAAALFLRRNGWLLKAGNIELEGFTLQVADSKADIPQIALWLKRHSEKEILECASSACAVEALQISTARSSDSGAEAKLRHSRSIGRERLVYFLECASSACAVEAKLRHPNFGGEDAHH